MNCIRRKVEREKEGCKKCKRRRRLRERRKRGDRGGELIDDLGNYLRPFVYSFFPPPPFFLFFFFHPFRSFASSPAYRPIARNEASSFIHHHHFFAPNPSFTRCSPVLRDRERTYFFAPFSFIITWPHHLRWQYFLEWMDEQSTRP